LDSCHKYRFEPSKREYLSGFLNNLKDKKQNRDQQKQAAHAISVFHEIKWANSNKNGNIEARTINSARTKTVFFANLCVRKIF
jgi:hypothetical protein